jgi:hypothetical protein
MMQEKIFKINKAIAIADLTVEFYKSANKLITIYSGNKFLLGSMLWNLKSAYDGQLSLIKNARYEDHDETRLYTNQQIRAGNKKIGNRTSHQKERNA